MVRCSTSYPTSSHFFKDFSPKITCSLWHLQSPFLYWSSPLSTKTRQTLLTQQTLPPTTLLCIPLLQRIFCFLHLLIPFPYPTILFASYPIATWLAKVAINFQVPKFILHAFSSTSRTTPSWLSSHVTKHCFLLLCWFLLLCSTTNQMSFLCIKANGVTSH